MNNNLIPYDAGKIEILKRNGGLALPYSNDIFLLDCHIAGTSHVEDINSIYPDLYIDQKIILRRESSNKHDGLAILVLTEDQKKLGYIPRDQNEVISRLMDAGKRLFAQIQSIKDKNGWKNINIKVYMSDL